MASFKLEAETFDLDENYEKNQSFIQVKDTEDTGTAKTTFSRDTGVYDIKLAYIDAENGDGAIEIVVNNESIAKIGLLANDDQAKTPIFPNISIEQGDEIKLIGTRDEDDLAKIDFVEFSLVEEDDNSDDNNSDNGNSDNGNSNDSNNDNSENDDDSEDDDNSENDDDSEE